MTMFARGNIRTAVKTLRRNKARSLLTMLGVIIGVMSVVLVIGIGDGVRQQVDVQTDHLGRDLITIRPGQLLGQSVPDALGGLGVDGNGAAAGGALGGKDITAISKTPGVAAVVPLSLVDGGVVSGENNRRDDALVLGTSSGLPDMLHQSLAFGAFFGDDPTAAGKVIIGSQVAQTLYDENVPLGQTLTILGHRFVVAGIFDDFPIAPFSADADFNDAVFIPYSTARSITNDNSPLYEILARPADASQTDAVVSRLKAKLLAAHGGQHDFTVLEQSQIIAVTDRILGLLAALIAGVAAIALLVGGIGIANVMLVSVTERMHEVGIRKAVGATNRQILSQFITEAAVLSVGGGAIGILLSLFAEVCLRLFTSLMPIMPWPAVIIASTVSIAVGILFGSVPALKAARKDPISALRNE